jgi:hypothetical protein
MTNALNAEKLRCSACGLVAACDCGAEYVSASAYARIALTRNPEKSNRALAAEAGVDKNTVRKIRLGGDFSPPDASAEKVVGIDGKSYPAQRRKKTPSMDLPFKDQPEVQRFMKALLKLSWEQKLYLWDHVLPKYHPRGIQETGHGKQTRIS